MVSTPASWSPQVAASERVGSFSGLLPYVFLALGSVLYLLPFVRALAWCPDEGVSEYGAQAILHGAMPGREFIELYAPGAYYWLALFFRLFGASVAVARGFLLGEAVATTLLVFYLARRLGGVGLFAAVFALVTSIPFGPLNTPHYDANLFALLSFSIFLFAERRFHEAAQQRRSLALFLTAGALAGCTSCIMQQKGLLVVAAFAISVAILQRRRSLLPLVALFAGFVLPIGGGLAFYAWRGALADLIYANFTLPRSLYNNINAVPYGFPLWSEVLPAWFRVLVALLPLPVALLFLSVIAVPFLLILCLPLAVPVLGYFRRSRAFRPDWLPYWFTGYALWLSESHRLDTGHLRNGAVLLGVLFFTLSEKYYGPLMQRVALGVTACIICLGAGVATNALSSHTLLQGRRGALLSAGPDKALDFLMEHTQPGEDVFIYPYRPLYYFFAGLHNPTRLSTFLYDPAATGLFRQAVKDIDTRRPHYVLWDTRLAGKNIHQLFPAYREPPPDELIIEPYLRTHYHQVAFENGFHILERNR